MWVRSSGVVCSVWKECEGRQVRCHKSDGIAEEDGIVKYVEYKLVVKYKFENGIALITQKKQETGDGPLAHRVTT